MTQEYLRDDYVKGLKHKPLRYEVIDADLKHFAVRVGARTKIFVFNARIGEAKNTARRTIGVFREPDEKKPPSSEQEKVWSKRRFRPMSTEEARMIARRWNALVDRGIDPAEEQKLRDRLEQLKTRCTYGSVVEDYIAGLHKRKRNRNVERDVAFIRRNLINPKTNDWIDRPIGEVTDSDVSALIAAIAARGAQAQAMKALVMIRTFFRWAMVPDRRRAIGLEHNPVADLTPNSMSLSKGQRTRHFMYHEIRAYLLVAAATPYPWGPFQRCLIETGQRRGEVAGMRWSQVDLERKLWVIPGGSGKPDEDHHVPLSDAVVDMLRALRSEQSELHGDFVFSLSNGQRPLTSFAKEKAAFTERFLAEFEELAPGRSLRHWVWHDVRRTLRTHFSAFASDTVAETAIGHGKKGIQRVYDLFKYRRKVRAAFNTWSEILRKIFDGTAGVDDLEDADRASAFSEE